MYRQVHHARRYASDASSHVERIFATCSFAIPDVCILMRMSTGCVRLFIDVRMRSLIDRFMAFLLQAAPMVFGTIMINRLYFLLLYSVRMVQPGETHFFPSQQSLWISFFPHILQAFLKMCNRFLFKKIFLEILSRNRKPFAAFPSTCRQYFSAALCAHPSSESVGILTLSFRRLERSFHGASPRMIFLKNT